MRFLTWTSAALALGLAAPALADAPADLPGQIAGVIGSGPALSLKFKSVAGQPTRILSPGDVYAEGWVLSGLTPSLATLTKAGESRSIGLNPAGALDQAASTDPATQVKVVFSEADLALFEGEIASGRWDGKAFTGLTLDETRRMIVYTHRLSGSGGGAARSVLGADYDDWMALGNARMLGSREAAVRNGDVNYVRWFDGLPPIGPDRFYVPAGALMSQAGLVVGLPSTAGYVTAGDKDASGGFTMVKGPGRGSPLVSAN